MSHCSEGGWRGEGLGEFVGEGGGVADGEAIAGCTFFDEVSHRAVVGDDGGAAAGEGFDNAKAEGLVAEAGQDQCGGVAEVLQDFGTRKAASEADGMW